MNKFVNSSKKLYVNDNFVNLGKWCIRPITRSDTSKLLPGHSCWEECFFFSIKLNHVLCHGLWRWSTDGQLSYNWSCCL